MSALTLARRNALMLILLAMAPAACSGPKKPSEQDIADFVRKQLPPNTTLIKIDTRYDPISTLAGTTLPEGSWQVQVNSTVRIDRAIVSPLGIGLFAMPGQAPQESMGTSPELHNFAHLYFTTLQAAAAQEARANALGANSGLAYHPGGKADNLVGHNVPSIDLPNFVKVLAPAGKTLQGAMSVLATPAAQGWHFEAMGVPVMLPFGGDPLDPAETTGPTPKTVLLDSPAYTALVAKLQALHDALARPAR